MQIKKIHSYANFVEILKTLEVDTGGLEILQEKQGSENFFIKDLKTPAANILKQDALSIGADLAVPKNTIIYQDEYVNAVLMCNKKQLRKLIKKEKIQPFGLKAFSKEIEQYLKLPSHPLEIMGVLNLNSDSFYKESRANESSILSKALKMVEDGAQIIDFGAVSSRPGSEPVSAKEEMARAKETIDILYKEKLYEKVELSLDSFQAPVIKYALDHGFSFVNDITGLANEEVCKVVSQYNSRVCIMHMQKNPTNMQQDPSYSDVVFDIKDFFKQRVQRARDFGIDEERIVLDVGIGFGKTLEHNCQLINAQEDFLSLGFPLLVGASRKSMIEKIIPKTPISERLPGSLAIHMQSVQNGASIIRCHDVAEHSQGLQVLDAIRKTPLKQ